jgi:thymidylate synthase
MTHIITARNVNEAFQSGLYYLRSAGFEEETRNGPCLVAPGPVITEYVRPQERILWDTRRDANPVFHLMEAVWMLAGGKNLQWLIPFNSKFGQYGNANGDQHGAYGHRWRHHFGIDQLLATVKHLKDTPHSRRAVIGMWDPEVDLGAQQADIPCNTHIYVDLRGGKLNITVCCRSNDMLWGAYGANVVHFSILQEVLATALSVPIGKYIQISNNFHLYTELPMVQDFLKTPPTGEDCYAGCYLGTAIPTRLIDPRETWTDFLVDCHNFVNTLAKSFRTSFFNEVAYPLRQSYLTRKDSTARPVHTVAGDWGMAYSLWLSRRQK